jgi:hypothetical protein
LTFQFIGTRNKSKYQIYENVFAKYAIKYFKKLSNENKLMDSFNNSWDQLEIRIEKQNFEEFRFIFNEMYRLKLIIKKGDNINLWHYTTQDKFLNIIKKREI